MFFKKHNDDEMIIKRDEYEKLKDIEKFYNNIHMSEPLDLAGTITNNAIAVNKASQTRLKQVCEVEEITNSFINKSNEIKEVAKDVKM